MVNEKKLFTIRKKNGINRIVQVNKSATGKNIYASDKRRCNGKTYRTKTMAQSALKKMKTKSAFGKKRRRSRSRSRRKSKSKGRKSVWNKFFVCRDPEVDNQVKICNAVKLKFMGDEYKIIQIRKKSAFEDEEVRLLDDDQKLFSTRSAARNFATSVNLLTLAGIEEVSQFIPTEEFREMVAGKSFRHAQRHKGFRDPDQFLPVYQRKYNINLGKPQRNRHSRNIPGAEAPKDVFHLFENKGRLYGDEGYRRPMGLWNSEERRRARARAYSRFGRQRQHRTNYGFSRYF